MRIIGKTFPDFLISFSEVLSACFMVENYLLWSMVRRDCCSEELSGFFVSGVFGGSFAGFGSGLVPCFFSEDF